MSKVTIDDTVYEVDPANNMLEECLSAGLDLPYFCWHPAMDSVGACRQCAMIEYADENDTTGRIVMACMTSPREGARYSLDNAATFRAQVIETLMINHPHDCPVCEEGGECHLQDMTVMSGHNYRRYRGKKITHRNQDLGPFIGHEMNRCITCYRCIRFYDDYAGGTDLSAQASHHHVYFGRFEEGSLENEFSGNLAEVCPTGVFTDKVFAQQYVRKWDLQTSPSICQGCSVGCNTNPGERYGTLRRITNRYNQAVNGYFICDRGRFGAGYVNQNDRILDSMSRDNPDADPVQLSREAALERLQNMNSAIGIGSPRASLEANFALREKVGADNFYAGIADDEYAMLQRIIEVYQSTPSHIASISDMEDCDAVLVIGEDLTNTAARVALALRQSVRNESFRLAAEQQFPLWHDAAIRKLAMNRKSPLYILSPHSTRLDDVACELHIASHDRSAQIAAAIAHVIDASAPAVTDMSEAEQSLVERIANDLKQASKPLIISGTQAMTPAQIDAAANLARALSQPGSKGQARLALIGAEANSLGLALLAGPEQTLSRAMDSASSQVIVLENDLYRRAASQAVDTFLRGLEQLAVIDHIKTRSSEQAHLVCASATFAESSGTMVSYEGRAQHYYATFKPSVALMPAHRWLSPASTLGELSEACALSDKRFKAILDLTPGRDFTFAGLRVPRQQSRYSGRTAMRAHINVHEPKQTQDEEGILNFSMEGVPPVKDAAVFNTAWAPGWNSNQSVFKFQDEVNGPLRQASEGTRLFDAVEKGSGDYFKLAPTPTAGEGLRRQPIYHLFGSEELSGRTKAIRERATSAYLVLSPGDAKTLSVGNGEGLEITVNGDSGAPGTIKLPCLIRHQFQPGTVGVTVGLPGLNIHDLDNNLLLSRTDNWQAPPEWRPEHIIVSDRERN